jgi:hypothetical protein
MSVGGFLLGFDQGGVVPGRIGAPRLAVVHGGETITPPGRSSGGGQPIVNIQIKGDILSHQRWATREDVIMIGIEQHDNSSSPWAQTMERRRSRG